MDESGRVARRSRGVWVSKARIVVAIVATAGVALLAAACGGSPRSQVAQLGSTTTQASALSTGSGGSPSAGGSPKAETLAFSNCMRSNGVSGFPDPNSSGQLPKRQVAQLAAGDPRFPAAHRTCGHLLPNGGQPTQAQVQQAWNDMRNFARCMRSHGVPNWPDPTDTSPQDNRPFFNTPASIDPNAPQIESKISACQHLTFIHANNPLETTQ
ncbi:MAG: hypothetical protein ACREF3_08000 [Acetobacteraceae bacterium]